MRVQKLKDSQTQRTAEIVTNIQNLTQNVTQLLDNLSQTAGQIAHSRAKYLEKYPRYVEVTFELWRK